jgi:hypothetical protein
MVFDSHFFTFDLMILKVHFNIGNNLIPISFISIILYAANFPTLIRTDFFISSGKGYRKKFGWILYSAKLRGSQADFFHHTANAFY